LRCRAGLEGYCDIAGYEGRAILKEGASGCKQLGIAQSLLWGSELIAGSVVVAADCQLQGWTSSRERCEKKRHRQTLQ
jgi:hypothetical protein